MRKRIINQTAEIGSRSNQQWLNLEHLAQVEVTSEEGGHPVESALMESGGSGWRAVHPGQQTVRLIFDDPQKVRRMRLVFREDEWERTQQFVLRWSSDGGQSYREILRQQYHFSPPGTTTESEDYTVEIDGLTALELSIVPDISGGPARASLAELRLA
jgi:F5/8 type C domain